MSEPTTKTNQEQRPETETGKQTSAAMLFGLRLLTRSTFYVEQRKLGQDACNGKLANDKDRADACRLQLPAAASLFVVASFLRSIAVTRIVPLLRPCGDECSANIIRRCRQKWAPI